MQQPDIAHRFTEHASHVAASALHAASIRDLIDQCVHTVRDALSADLTQVLEYDPKRNSFVLRASESLDETVYDEVEVPAGLFSQTGRAFLDPSGEPVALEDFTVPHDWADERSLKQHGVRSGMAVRFSDANRHIGVLGAYWLKPHAFSRAQKRFLHNTAQHLAAGYQRLQTSEAAAAWRSRSELLAAGVNLLSVPAQRDHVLFAAAAPPVNASVPNVPPMADWCLVDAIDSTGRYPHVTRVAIEHTASEISALEEPLSTPLRPSTPHGTARVYATRTPELVVRCDDEFVRSVARDRGHRRVLEEARPYSYICVPVIGEERTYGAVSFLRTEGGHPVTYDESDVETCVRYADTVAVAVERGRPHTDIAAAQDAMREQTDVPQAPSLTPRERDVLRVFADGFDLRETAETLHLTYETVRGYKKSASRKLDLPKGASVIQIVVAARRLGLV